MASGLLVGLLLVDWQVALATLGLVGTAYGLWQLAQGDSSYHSEQIGSANSQRVQALQEGLVLFGTCFDGSQSSYLEL